MEKSAVRAIERKVVSKVWSLIPNFIKYLGSVASIEVKLLIS